MSVFSAGVTVDAAAEEFRMIDMLRARVRVDAADASM